MILERIRVDIGNVEGPLEELVKYKDLGGFTDGLETDFDDPEVQTNKPMLYGTYTITNTVTETSLYLVRTYFPTLTINAPDLIVWEDLALQTLDPTKPGYNPAAAIRLCNLGFGEITVQEGSSGSYILSKEDAAKIPQYNSLFEGLNFITDTKGIVSHDKTKRYVFRDATFFQYFTRFTSLQRTFLGCNFVKHVVLPETVTNANSAFQNMVRLETINIPVSLTRFENSCFNNCGKLKNHTYSGTLQQWCSIYFQYVTDNPCAYDRKLIIQNEEMTEVSVPVMLSTLHYTFVGTNITSVTIPNTITSIEGTFRGCRYLTDINLPNNILTLGGETFYGCTSIETFEVLPNVITIGGSCFRECSKLREITFNDSVVTSIGGYAFNYCTSLESIVLPETLVSIGERTFENCTKLSSITIPQTVTSVGYQCFNSANNIKNVVYTGTIEQWCKISFYSDDARSNPCWNRATFTCTTPDISTVTLPTSVLTLRGNFQGIQAIHHVILHENLNRLDSYCFYNSGIEELTIPNSVYSLGSEIINGSNVTSVTIGSGVTSLPRRLFCGAGKLQSLTVPNWITSIGGELCRYCYALRNVILPNSITSIPSWAFADTGGTLNITLGNAVTTINDLVFNGTTVIYLDLPSTVTTLAENALTGVRCAHYEGTNLEQGSYRTWFNIINYKSSDGFVYTDDTCTVLMTMWENFTNVIIPEGVTRIASNAFYGRAIESVSFPTTLTTINDSAFSRCYRLYDVVIPDTVTSIGSYAFDGVPHIKTSYNSNFSARWRNCYVDTDGVYTDSHKTTLLAVNPNQNSYTFPSSVTTIRGYAFAYYTKFQSLVIPNTVTTLSDERTFYANSYLKQITLPNTITRYPNYAFDGTGLTSYYYDGTLEDWLKISFDTPTSTPACRVGKLLIQGVEVNSVVVPSTVTSVRGNILYNCKNVTSITLHNRINSIGGNALRGTQIEQIELPETVVSLGGYCFAETKLHDIEIGMTVTSIGDGIFYRCKELGNVNWSTLISSIGREFLKEAVIDTFTIPSTITYINMDAFRESTIKTIKIPQSVTNIQATAFYNTSLGTIEYSGTFNDWFNIYMADSNSSPLRRTRNLKIDGELITGSLTWPEELTYFQNSNAPWILGISEITFTDSFTGSLWGFYYNTSLQKATVGNEVTTLSNEVFHEASNLNYLYLGEGITSIGNYALRHTYLDEMVVLATTPPTLQTQTFFDWYRTPIIWVPDESVSLYKEAAIWSNVASYIFPLSDRDYYISY